MAAKHNIPRGKMHSNCRLLPDHIVCKITQRNNMRRANSCDPALKLLNEGITSDIHKHNLWKGHLDAHWDHRHNTHIIWETIHGLSNRAPPPYTSFVPCGSGAFSLEEGRIAPLPLPRHVVRGDHLECLAK